MAMHITTTHPFDDRRVLTSMVTGRLPDSKPIIARGQVYCGHDFRQRAVAWFLEEKKKLAAIDAAAPAAPTAAATTAADTKSKKKKPSTPPTRVQPPRAAKRKAESSSSAQRPPKKIKKKVTPLVLTNKTRAPVGGILPQHYTLAPALYDASVAEFQAELAAVLDTKRPVASSCRWPASSLSSSSFSPRFPSPAPPSSPTPTSACTLGRPGDRTPRSLWCPIVAEPLACIDRAYCLHAVGRAPPSARSLGSTTAGSGLSRMLSRRGSPAPEAAMSPPDTPPPEIVFKARAKEFAELRHVQERTVELGGLRFAVDVCDGSMRVWMV